jgi:hypothetical protein
MKQGPSAKVLPAAFSWHCGDCDQSGSEVIEYPIHPDTFSERFYVSHRATTLKRHCACPGHYLSVWPNIPNHQRASTEK